jgi:hypothetical protein
MSACTHLDQIKDVKPSSKGCEESSSTGHPVIRSLERGEDWRRCYVDNAVV